MVFYFHAVLHPCYQTEVPEAGCDEAGRGCLAGPVFAAAVVLPPDFKNTLLNDSKKLNEKQRNELRILIEKEAVTFHVAAVDNETIDQINILQASIRAMHIALGGLRAPFGFIAVDGNRFRNFLNIPHKTIVKGDGLYMNIAAASVLAKTWRDEFMTKAHEQFPQYGWLENKGYGTLTHREAIKAHGYSPLHRRSFVLKETQARLW